MQWWGALTQQFQQIAASAMKDAAKQTALDTTRNMATGLAKEALKTATGMAAGRAVGAGRRAACGDPHRVRANAPRGRQGPGTQGGRPQGAGQAQPGQEGSARRPVERAAEHTAPSAAGRSMKRFPTAHATHPQWRMAVALVLAQLRAQMAVGGVAAAPTLGLLYITDHYAAEAAAAGCALRRAARGDRLEWHRGRRVRRGRVPDEPGPSVMLLDLPPTSTACFPALRPAAQRQRPICSAHGPGPCRRPHARPSRPDR